MYMHGVKVFSRQGIKEFDAKRAQNVLCGFFVHSILLKKKTGWFSENLSTYFEKNLFKCAKGNGPKIGTELFDAS